MKIELDYDVLKEILANLINHIGCFECPYYEECDGSEDCAELFIDKIINH